MQHTYEYFQEMHAQALVLFEAQPSEKAKRVSLDTIFNALACGHLAEQREHRRQQQVQDRPTKPPEWFAETLTRMAGEKATVSRFLMMAGRYPVQRAEAVDVGRWLRESGRIPTKKGGQLIFDL